MNTLLEKLFETYRLSEKDRYDINQIFALLPSEKQQNLLNNFDKLAFKLNKIQEDLLAEQEILLWGLYKDIDKIFEKEQRKSLVMNK